MNMSLAYFRQRIVPELELVESAKDDLMISLYASLLPLAFLLVESCTAGS